MKVSLTAIKWQGYNDLFDLGVDALVEKIGAQLGAVEEVIDLGKKYDGVIVAKVVSCVDHPDADRLHICLVDDGGVAKDVERNQDGFVQVVCGAPNVREGMLVAWLPPGATVPATADKDPFVLEARALRGQTSNGMLASASELALSDNHDGLLEIDQAQSVWTPEGDKNPAPGMPFKLLYGLDDTIIDIENKMFTHRPDCFGLLGVGREIAGIQHKAFKSPDWYLEDPTFPSGDGLPLTVKNELPELVSRFVAASLKNITVGPSPIWLQSFLTRLSVKSINNIVDVTNYIMLLTGQPLHAYDYDKVKALSDGEATITVRHALENEEITLLNGKTIQPRKEAIMIATNKKLIGVGGVMGGADTEVDNNTKNIILECATFDMYSIRRTSMAHGLFTDAVTRNNKGQSPLQNDRITAQAISMIIEHAGGEIASDVIDEAQLKPQKPVTVTAEFINERLGLQLTADAMRDLLENVEFTVVINGSELTIQAPFWRTDIEIAEDVVEEVGRLYGFDHLPLELPKRSITPTRKDPLLELKSQLRDRLSRAGANEVLTYSFVHSKLLERAGQPADQAFALSNALSPDLQNYRLSLMPSLLDKVHPNVKAGYDHFVLFELGKGHNTNRLDEDGLPIEFEILEAVVAASGKAAPKGAAFYEARSYLEYLLQPYGIDLEFRPVKEPSLLPAMQVFDQQRLALVYAKGSDKLIGAVGEFTPSVRKNFKLSHYSAGFNISLVGLQKSMSASSSYVPLPRFPKVEQDICLKVSTDLPFQELADFVVAELHKARDPETRAVITPIDSYQREDDPGHKQITFRISIAHFEKTMTDTEVNGLLDVVAQAAKTTYSAERI
ncbi:MAG: Phenylalanine-tRNA ligase beta subunit [Candidatus Saccharibacteria bacterium]|nr:Phenylalanine-tRNA ligase beta subunit [Candidatus Saccharibacteria bacterium]